MANEILLKQGTSVMFSTSVIKDVEFDFTELVGGTARQSDSYDFGTDIDTWWSAYLRVEFDTAAPDAGRPVDVWIAWSDDDAKWPGGVAGADGAYKGGEELEWAKQLQYIGSLITTNDLGPQEQVVGGFYPKARYGSLILYLNAPVFLTTDNRQNELILIPTTNEVQ